ncbi:hypothetical protein SERLA73DRAFT_74317 [Serpula lacrymans var. lacrymans S7.3]|uniref:WW domain-containing protein n=2 Tax=Serpula lacrymans var. lacrymans TaxID=341189 RepID=F8Q186_SERL3|nr:uncharacterized protein SERLADRAFT_438963 [Serpula lacrymans var. lacrymans S7.9]EGN98064.1 hypothetical protein SERLA73DRAFT_74317 [Serpula lacrymans var. lacrymans S7.3]EGO23653.1 hypothetical protein SERLADRAFT_438963 [Serpula lacrymans var. lacrymans S7.9]
MAHNSTTKRRPYTVEVNTSFTPPFLGDRIPVTAKPAHEGESSFAHCHTSTPTSSPAPHPTGFIHFSSAYPISSHHNLDTPTSGERSSRPASMMTSTSRRSLYQKYTGPPLPHTGSDTHLSSPTGTLVAPPNNGYPGSPVLTPGHPFVYPVSVKNIRRYGKKEIIDPKHSSHEIPELKLNYPAHDETLPDGWVKPFHPEGAYYFMHKAKRIFTHVDIHEKEDKDNVMEVANYLWNDLRELNSARFPGLDLSEVELVVELEFDEGEDAVVGRYYFVSPQHRCVLWLTEYNGNPFLNKCKGVHLLSHKMNAQYWHHLELFPNLCRLTQGMITELKYMLLQAHCDHITSHSSAAPSNAQTLTELSSIVRDLRPSKNKKDTINSVWIVGRIMGIFAHNQFINFHGQKGARLELHHLVHGESPTRSTMMFFLSHVFFGTPITYVEALDSLFVDGCACIFTWTKFMESLNSDLQEFNLLATVLLNANVGFLAIQSVNSGSGTNDDTRSLTQVASYLSLVASGTAATAATFLEGMSHRKYGQETLAIIYSLPSALLMMLFFLAAFSIECYQPQDSLSRSLVGIASSAVGILVVWCIYSLKSECNGRGTGWWKILLPLGMQKLYPKSIGSSSINSGGSQLSLHSHLREKVVSWVRTESTNAQDREMQARPEREISIQV